MPRTPVRKRKQVSTYQALYSKARRRLMAPTLTLPPSFSYDEDHFQDRLFIGAMAVKCGHCGAQKFNGERPGFCCSSGKIVLETFPRPPPYLYALLTHADVDSRHFLHNIRRYNNAFQMTSFGYNKRILPGWNPTFTVQGQVYHRIGSLHPPPSSPEPTFLQVYFIDNQLQIENRLSFDNELKERIITSLTDMLHTRNEHIRLLKSANEVINQNTNSDLRIVIREDKTPTNEHPGRFNAQSQSSNEVGILMPDDPTQSRDIIIHQRDGILRHISELHRSYDSLQYPILFPYGTDGYSLYLKNESNRKITQMQYYAFHMQNREDNYLLRNGRLFQQFLVDAYCKIETERLNFIRREQKSLRADSYQNLRDSIITDDCDPRQLGQRVILPSSYTGGPRYMHERQQDAITYVRHYGRPQLFITTTTNPNWKEIVDSLLPAQTPNDRPDIVTRVFHMKLSLLMKLLKDGAFGDLAAWLYSVEFQKRGLPHAHILLWLKADSKIQPDHIDKISAEIPCELDEPVLHNLVVKNMIHGPCGPFNFNSPCMKDGNCSKNFPKEFQEITDYGADNYPKYKRRSPEDGGKTVQITKMINGKKIVQEVDNKFVVPYNKWLLAQMKCHTNVEMCSSVKSIKYVLKYVTKGSDQAIFSVQLQNEKDEILLYQQARFVGSMEAAHRILGFPMHEHWPPVTPLTIHLENGQRVYFDETSAAMAAISEPPSTTLTQFFKMCATDDFAKTLLYYEMPTYYTWSAKKWRRRKQGVQVPDNPGVKAAAHLGRLYTINPKQGECYFLRILLNYIRGPTSFADCKTVNGVIHITYREACLAQGLIENDQHLTICLKEACESSSPNSLRQLFAIILTSCEPANPLQLWTDFQEHLSEDIVHECHANGNIDINDTLLKSIHQKTLALIEDSILLLGGHYLQTYGLPTVQRQTSSLELSLEYQRYVHYDTPDQEKYVDEHFHKLTEEQTSLYNEFMHRVNVNSSGILFLDAPGGTGKTFLINIILATLRANKKVVIACASSGIAATLISGGRTIHSTFKVPLNIDLQEVPLCGIKKKSAIAEIIKRASAIIIDEAPMTNKIVYEAMDRSLQDIRENTKPFGGIPVLLCGDFRQLLPVIRNGSRAKIISSSIKLSSLWKHTKTVHLTKNMRAEITGDTNSAEYATYLKQVGDGQIECIQPPDIIAIDNQYSTVTDQQQLMDAIYGDLQNHTTDSDWFLQRAILAPLNDTVNDFNIKIMNSFPGTPVIYSSIDTTIPPESAVHYPVEFLNSLEISGIPPHVLNLKIGCPVMIMRSLNPPHLTNGTRCVISKLHNHVIEVKLINGPSKGQVHLIPRIPIIPSDTDLPFQFRRLQFPLRPCFAMTINKSQGQTFSHIKD